MWKMLPSGTTRLSIGATAQTTISAMKNAVQPVPLSSGARPGRSTRATGAGGSNLGGTGGGVWTPASAAIERSIEEMVVLMDSSLGAATLHREDALRPLLDEDD